MQHTQFLNIVVTPDGEPDFANEGLIISRSSAQLSSIEHGNVTASWNGVNKGSQDLNSDPLSDP